MPALELTELTEELEGTLGRIREKNGSNANIGGELHDTLARVRKFFDDHAELGKLFGHDGGNFGESCKSYALKMKQGGDLNEQSYRILTQTLHGLISVLWSINLSGTSNPDELPDFYKKTRKTLKLSEFLRQYLPFILYKYINNGNYTGRYKNLFAASGDYITKIVQEIIQNDDQTITLQCPPDLANFMANAVSNALKRGFASDVEITYHDGILAILDNGTGIDESHFPDANNIFQGGVSGTESTGLGMRDLEKRGISATAEHHGGHPTHQDLLNYYTTTDGLTPLSQSNRGAAIRILLHS